MKTNLLFTAMVLIGLTSANAKTTNVAPQGEDFNNTARYRYAEPVTFMERGVEFLIFPDGSFDFNTTAGDSFGSYNDFYNDSYYYRDTNSRRSSVNSTQGAPGTVSRSSYYTPNYGGVLIQHDFDGKVRRIGNVFINYDRDGKVKRVGTIYINYNRADMLTQVGGLRITYNNWGEVVKRSGTVNYANSQYNKAFGQNHSLYYAAADADNDQEYYYYKQGNEVKKQKKIKR